MYRTPHSCRGDPQVGVTSPGRVSFALGPPGISRLLLDESASQGLPPVHQLRAGDAAKPSQDPGVRVEAAREADLRLQRGAAATVPNPPLRLPIPDPTLSRPSHSLSHLLFPPTIWANARRRREKVVSTDTTAWPRNKATELGRLSSSSNSTNGTSSSSRRGVVSTFAPPPVGGFKSRRNGCRQTVRIGLPCKDPKS